MNHSYAFAWLSAFTSPQSGGCSAVGLHHMSDRNYSGCNAELYISPWSFCVNMFMSNTYVKLAVTMCRLWGQYEGETITEQAGPELHYDHMHSGQFRKSFQCHMYWSVIRICSESKILLLFLCVIYARSQRREGRKRVKRWKTKKKQAWTLPGKSRRFMWINQGSDVLRVWRRTVCEWRETEVTYGLHMWVHNTVTGLALTDLTAL